MRMTLLSQDEIENATRFTKIDNIVYNSTFFLGVILVGIWLFLIIRLHDIQIWSLAIFFPGIIMIGFSAGSLISEGLFPGSSIGVFCRYRIVKIPAGKKYHLPSDHTACIIESSFDRYAVEYAEPRQFYGYKGRWWTNIGCLFNSEAAAKEYIKEHKRNQSNESDSSH